MTEWKDWTQHKTTKFVVKYRLFSSFLCFFQGNYFSILVQSLQNKSTDETKDLCVCWAIDSLGRPLCPLGVVVYQGKNARHLMTSFFWFTFLCVWVQNLAIWQHTGICCSCLRTCRDCNCFCLLKSNSRFICSKSSCCIVIHLILISYMFLLELIFF